VPNRIINSRLYRYAHIPCLLFESIDGCCWWEDTYIDFIECATPPIEDLLPLCSDSLLMTSKASSKSSPHWQSHRSGRIRDIIHALSTCDALITFPITLLPLIADYVIPSIRHINWW
jgi:hypothetical protein